MRVLLFGATGMVGQGVLRECLRDPGIEQVVTIGRSATGARHAKLRFRPGFIQPLHGIRSKTPLYRALYALTTPLMPMVSRVFPNAVTTTEQVGRAMIAVARNGFPRPLVEQSDINTL